MAVPTATSAVCNVELLVPQAGQLSTSEPAITIRPNRVEIGRDHLTFHCGTPTVENQDIHLRVRNGTSASGGILMCWLQNTGNRQRGQKSSNRFRIQRSREVVGGNDSDQCTVSTDDRHPTDVMFRHGS